MPDPIVPSPCPIPDAHRRLMDCHAHWHAALDEYMDPDGFRVHLNSLVQALRNVTWLLQKQKASLPDFAEWYPKWQNSVKDDPVMKWVIKARNRIVKEADLELNSTARLVVALDWVHGGEKVFTVPPRWTPRDIAQMMVRKGVPPGLEEGESSLTIERRWVDRLLPDRELLTACAHALGQLTIVLQTAHAQFGIKQCDLNRRTRECVGPHLEFPLACMWLGENPRTTHFDFATLAPYDSRHHIVRLDPELAEVAQERYGVFQPLSGGPVERVRQILEMGKATLVADGFIATTVWLMRGEQVIDMQVPVFFDQASKMLAMHGLAARVEMLNADGFGLLGEVWTAPAPSAEQMRSGAYARARDHPDRTEGIHAFGMTKDGGFLSVVAPFTRDGEKFVIGGADYESEPGVLMMMRPIMKVWGIEDPHPIEAAMRMAEQNDKQNADDREA